VRHNTHGSSVGGYDLLGFALGRNKRVIPRIQILAAAVGVQEVVEVYADDGLIAAEDRLESLVVVVAPHLLGVHQAVNHHLGRHEADGQSIDETH